MSEPTKTGEPTAVERARTMVHPLDNAPTEPPPELPEVDPDADTGEHPSVAPEPVCGPTGRPHRWVYSSRKDAEVCGDCGARR